MKVISASTNGSIVEESIMFGQFGWPECEPVMNSNDYIISSDLRNFLLEKCSVSKSLPSENWWKEKWKKNVPLPTIVRDYINHHSIQFNPRTVFASSSEILKKIELCVNERKRIDIILPVFCIVNNWQKRHDITSVTMAEEASLLHLAKFSSYLEKNTGVSIRFNILSDATFYAGIIGSPMGASEKYIQDLKTFTQEQKIDDIVNVTDMSDIVSQFRSEYEYALSEHLKVFTLDPFFGISPEEAIRFQSSVGNAVNISDLPLTYDQKKAMFCDSIFPSQEIKQEIMDRINKSFVHYRAMKEAMAAIQWENALFPHAIRASIHHKTMPILGVRVYPNYKSHSPTLPYHGIAVIEHRDNVWRMNIEQEIHQHGKRLRITNNHGVSDFYIDADTLENLSAIS
ncbi:L-tyrosine/L-tryptophan isonitrile synthase family protein [Xenorhabdus sp. Flor]|uniref:L-tyrosine/L-tryptophan isonitrile synthase family protein n=1 Tax=Xenorhabdus cabanillasii TaxID=351673 RepID=UPI0019C05FA1|nr:L-tyrosine/L-tryptophan isonitrile synthase family protein [Xenorhabdus sp. Flor]MBD2815772.1 L-tyrosine/L-tryptophan isonitrile synthase family protein [Xenorhabdus sp. Flor]